ncbi:MAG: chlorophyll synthesis pathway protein BchC, partial [Gammaproteobacteria bacterium]|nr:chlorophyll synthesis pathway protein BchC [Gammaproteobacteria bacterium]
MQSLAVVLDKPEHLSLRALELSEPGSADLVVDIEFSGVSTGTERLLWSGRMPAFPGMGYPLVPGYESVGRVTLPDAAGVFATGQRVFVPGASCFGPVRGLFGGTASRLVVPASRAVAVDEAAGPETILLALAATAHHALTAPGARPPELIIGHGVLGRLLARLSLALGGPPPVVWEHACERQGGGVGYAVIEPRSDECFDYHSVYDVSGDASLVDGLLERLSPLGHGELVLAGFYAEPIRFDFVKGFMREARLRIAAQWRREDLNAVNGLVASGRLSLDGLITHRAAAAEAADAYR